LVNHLQALGQPVFGRTTPDGWPPGEAAWSGPGQLATRFDVARALVGGSNGGGNARLFRTEGVISLAAIPPARIASAAWLRTQGARAGAATQDVLAEALAARRGEWAWVALASPEFMRH